MKLTRFGFCAALLLLTVVVFAKAQETNSLPKQTQLVRLGETTVKINVYEKRGASKITFVAPHHNEQIGLRLAKEFVEKRGGRLVEIESLDETGNPQRRINFIFAGKSYSFDPNRIFTENGRLCSKFPPEIEPLVKTFAETLLKIMLARDGNKLRDGERFLVAVHNNRDVDERVELTEKAGDLTAIAFARNFSALHDAHNNFDLQAEGVYLSNQEYDADNFVFVSTPALMNRFAAEGFSAVLQKSAAKLKIPDCRVDDGSLSVFSALENIPYINLEADAKSGEFRQRQMLEAVYKLYQDTIKSEAVTKRKD
jgi:hypothetical protein